VNDVSIPFLPRAGRLAGRLAVGLLVGLLVAMTLPAQPASAAATPRGLRSTAVRPTSVSLAWRTVSRAPKYRIQYSTRSSMAGAKYHRFTQARARIIGLRSNTTYYVKVRVITTHGRNLSRYSPAIKVRTARQSVAPVPLQVGSYNVKCANCTGRNERPWAQRRGAVVSTIRNEHLDVLGLQEASQGWLKNSSGRPVNVSQFEDLQRRLGSPWRLTNRKRNNCVRSITPTHCRRKDQGASKGTRILYNSSRVTMLASGSKLLPSKDRGGNARYLAWAIFRQRSTGVKFFFANSHLQPGEDFYALRKREAQVAVRTIQRRNTAHLPVIAVGDFNSSRFADPSNAPYDAYIRAGFTDPLGGVANSTEAVDPQADHRTATWLNSFNGFARKAKGNRSWDNGSYIDYMLTTPMKVSEWETVARLRGSRFVGVIPSDHNMVRMTVYLPR
jgi:endonuclease/exonuclease/phosphatase family metal-dependent hydrolase